MQTPTSNHTPTSATIAATLAKLVPVVQDIVLDAAGAAAQEAGQGTDMFLIDQYADEAVKLLSALLAEARASQITPEHAASKWGVQQ